MKNNKYIKPEISKNGNIKEITHMSMEWTCSTPRDDHSSDDDSSGDR